ncbi:MAG: MoxR-like ATPase in aerotolerance operon [uncultured Sulfurovum sp.]|uniref:MoxR-like ATPase in aerotolerance operon n=1 Tax=uncultured Sulfurovum sp. TaxID=269237 RepID=A0A6S6SHD4_9BACT|nr:MAG: MoxR-like ATPase in aerotolerance operon [uncultured Sulfurovum sp.]
MQNKIKAIKAEIAKAVVGQEGMVEGLLIGLFCKGHILVEGVPGLAKTTTVKALSSALELDFHRVQFTPDLLPSDIVGAEIYDPQNNSFKIKKGPIFTQLLLADEINRSPSKVQSALLEAMQERQVTIGSESFELPTPFMVMATQNPLEQEGVYRLPEAQLDRFMMKLEVKHNSEEEELEIMRRIATKSSQAVSAILAVDELEVISEAINALHIDTEVEKYIVSLIRETRKENAQLRYGVSPRASIDLYKTAKAHAYLAGKSFVSPVDVLAMAYPVLRHRIGLSYEARAKGILVDEVLKSIIESIKIP